MSVDVAPGQSWAIRDDRYEGWRYVTVEAIEGDRVLVKPRSRRGRRSRIQLKHFGRSRFTMCGYDGPGDLPAYEGQAWGGCFNCGPRPNVLALTVPLAVGFGAVEVTRDGETVWAGDSLKKRLAHAELWARETPGDWRVTFNAPMSERMYQRKPEGWVLVWNGFGFA